MADELFAVFGDDFELIIKEYCLECEKEFKNHGATGCLEYFKSKKEAWKTIPLNVAVIGLSGTGKSTFINTIRGLKGDDSGAAAVGVNETTSDMKAYPHPNNEKLLFWDLPGVGTENFPKESYLEKIEFGRYDCFIIMTATRFLEIDAWLGEEIKKTKKGFYYIRSKIGIDVQNDKYNKSRNHDVAKLIHDIRDHTMAEIYKKLKFEAQLFLIDSHQRNTFDFDDVERRIVEDLPRIKRNAFALSLSAFSKSMIKIKVRELRIHAWYMAILSAIIAIVPLPGVSWTGDALIFIKEAMFYYKQLGVDEASLQARAKLFSADSKRLHEIVLRRLPAAINGNFIETIADGFTLSGESFYEEFVLYLCRILPYTAAPTSLAVTRYTLGCILDKLEEVALEIADFTEQLSTVAG